MKTRYQKLKHFLSLKESAKRTLINYEYKKENLELLEIYYKRLDTKNRIRVIFDKDKITILKTNDIVYEGRIRSLKEFKHILEACIKIINMKLNLNEYSLTLVSLDNAVTDEIAFSMIMRVNDRQSYFQNVGVRDNYKEEIISFINKFKTPRIVFNVIYDNNLSTYNTSVENLKKNLKSKFKLNNITQLMK